MDPQPPTILELDVFNNMQGPWPNYTYPNGVPVGCVLAYQATPNPSNFHFATVTWQGGTNIAYTFNNAPDSTPPTSMHVSTPVDTTGEIYGFIVDTTPRTYTVQCTVTYVEDATSPQTSTITFTSYRPTTASLSVLDQGTPKFYPNFNGSGVAVQYDNWSPGVQFPQNAGMRFQATTTTGRFGGTFMFLQTVVPQRTATTIQLGVTTNWVNAHQGQLNIDDVFTGTVGYPTDDSTFPNGPLVYSWRMDAWSGPTQKSMSDTPFDYLPLPVNPQTDPSPLAPEYRGRERRAGESQDIPDVQTRCRGLGGARPARLVVVQGRQPAHRQRPVG